MRVVFVDDEQHVIDGLRRSLRSHGSEFRISYYSNAADALEFVSDISPEPVVVVTDWRMPGFSGMDLCRCLRGLEAQGSERRFYVILLTGVREVDAAVEALDEGADEFVRKPCDAREIAARVRVGLRVLAAESELREANQKLAALACVDELTELLNRRKMNDVLANEFSRVERGAQSLGLMLLDVDNFKRCNDEYGHAAGDAVLRSVAARLRAESRTYDSVARWGGEEFLMLCPNVQLENVVCIAERLRMAISDERVSLPSGHIAEITISIGAAFVEAGSRETVEAALERADEQLYEAKNAGRDCVRIQSGSMDTGP